MADPKTPSKTPAELAAEQLEQARAAAEKSGASGARVLDSATPGAAPFLRVDN